MSGSFDRADVPIPEVEAAQPQPTDYELTAASLARACNWVARTRSSIVHARQRLAALEAELARAIDEVDQHNSRLVELIENVKSPEVDE